MERHGTNILKPIFRICMCFQAYNFLRRITKWYLYLEKQNYSNHISDFIIKPVIILKRSNYPILPKEVFHRAQHVGRKGPPWVQKPLLRNWHLSYVLWLLHHKPHIFHGLGQVYHFVSTLALQQGWRFVFNNAYTHLYSTSIHSLLQKQWTCGRRCSCAFCMQLYVRQVHRSHSTLSPYARSHRREVYRPLLQSEYQWGHASNLSISEEKEMKMWMSVFSVGA